MSAASTRAPTRAGRSRPARWAARALITAGLGAGGALFGVLVADAAGAADGTVTVLVESSATGQQNVAAEQSSDATGPDASATADPEVPPPAPAPAPAPAVPPPPPPAPPPPVVSASTGGVTAEAAAAPTSTVSAQPAATAVSPLPAGQRAGSATATLPHQSPDDATTARVELPTRHGSTSTASSTPSLARLADLGAAPTVSRDLGGVIGRLFEALHKMAADTVSTADSVTVSVTGTGTVTVAGISTGSFSTGSFSIGSFSIGVTVGTDGTGLAPPGGTAMLDDPSGTGSAPPGSGSDLPLAAADQPSASPADVPDVAMPPGEADTRASSTHDRAGGGHPTGGYPPDQPTDTGVDAGGIAAFGAAAGLGPTAGWAFPESPGGPAGPGGPQPATPGAAMSATGSVCQNSSKGSGNPLGLPDVPPAVGETAAAAAAPGTLPSTTDEPTNSAVDEPGSSPD